MLHNPNAFFYRNRPPGDPQKIGKFTPEEEVQFLERLRRFRELGIAEPRWGLFAAPIRGRLGYQCSTFYRILLNEGRIKDTSYVRDQTGHLAHRGSGKKVTPPESIRILVEEAIEFVQQCLAGGGVITGPVRLESAAEDRATVKERQEVEVAVEKVEKEEGSREERVPDYRGMDKWKSRKTSDLNWCCLLGAMDPETGLKMKRPYMDPYSGLVFDLSTWREIIGGERAIADEWWVESTDELIPLTCRNFEMFHLEISNM
jgi:hypothetical protein